MWLAVGLCNNDDHDNSDDGGQRTWRFGARHATYGGTAIAVAVLAVHSNFRPAELENAFAELEKRS